MHVQLAVPDLLWPDPQFKPQPRVPALERLLSKGRVRAGTAESLEDWLLEAFGVPGGGAAVYSLRAEGAEPGARHWLRADPCHLRVNRDRLVLVDSLAFDLNRDEADALSETLNRHFDADGLHIEALQPKRWYLRSDRQPHIQTSSIAAARGRDIDPLLPRGPEAMQWRSLLNEAQMLLHNHPVNEAREARGELPVNSIWLWGEGEAVIPPSRPFQRVRTHDALAAGLAQASGASVHPLPEDAAQWLRHADVDGRELVVLDALSGPASYGDLQTWETRIAAMEKDWFEPLLDALRRGRIGMLSVHVMGRSGRFDAETVRQDLRFFWRRVHPLARFGHAGE